MQAFVESAPWNVSWSDRLQRLWTSGRVPRGLYLVGPVGTGKTHLLAAAYHALEPDTPCGFAHSRTLFQQTAPPQEVAAFIARQCTVLCLDEVEIDDPANEARLVHTLQALNDAGVFLLATSNVRPEAFERTNVGTSRFPQFLRNAFGDRYTLHPVQGPDHRREHPEARPGTIWVGSPETTRPRLQQAVADGWCLSFDAFRTRSQTTAHEQLVESLIAHKKLGLYDVSIQDTDDALRLLRVVDALYTAPSPPTLYMTSSTPPDDWFAPDQFAGLAQAIAEKFTRTVSRLHAMCTVEHVTEAPVTADAAPSR